MPPVPLFVALADPTRCRIVEILRGGPQPVHALAASFSISRPAISRHLRVLKQARLISEKKSGRENVYALHRERLKPAAKWIETMLPVPAAKPKPAAKPPIKGETATRRAPVGEAIPMPPPPRPKPVSQMGFDF